MVMCPPELSQVSSQHWHWHCIRSLSAEAAWATAVSADANLHPHCHGLQRRAIISIHCHIMGLLDFTDQAPAHGMCSAKLSAQGGTLCPRLPLSPLPAGCRATTSINGLQGIRPAASVKQSYISALSHSPSNGLGAPYRMAPRATTLTTGMGKRWCQDCDAHAMEGDKPFSPPEHDTLIIWGSLPEMVWDRRIPPSNPAMWEPGCESPVAPMMFVVHRGTGLANKNQHRDSWFCPRVHPESPIKRESAGDGIPESIPTDAAT